MANEWHVEWLKEGVEKWNKRRKKVQFVPNLSGIKFFDYLPPDFRDRPKTSRYFERIDLSGADLRRSDLSNLNFTRANFSSADLESSDLSRTNFTGACFDDANLRNANASRSHFARSTFTRTVLDNANLIDASFAGAVLIETTLGPEQAAILSGSSARVFSSIVEFLTIKSVKPATPALPKATAEVKEGKSRKNLYDVFYGTTRQPIYERGSLVGFDGNWNSKISYGVCEVVIPESHRIGSLGSPLWKRLFNMSDDRIRISSLISMDKDLFFEFVRECDAGMAVRNAPTIFVHGFNTKFEDAILRAAQIGFDLGLGQGIGLFSWHSKGVIHEYPADEASVEASKYLLADFIEQFCEQKGMGGVNIIAHSMGCRCVLGALEVLASGRKSILRSVNQVILAAADVDTAIMPNLARSAIQYSARMTSYVSDRDQALKISGWLHSYSRVGIAPPTFVLSGMDTVLVNDLDLGALSHSYISSSRVILSDVFNLLKHNHPPEKRHSVEFVSDAGVEFWRIKN